jgi:uncharacterized protein
MDVKRGTRRESDMGLDVRAILEAVLRDYVLDQDGIHGVAHWARVMENGLRVAEETGADVDVVRLFALLHDSRRISDGTDPGHGPRAAEFARTLQGRKFNLSATRFKLLHAACAGHTGGRTHPDITVRTCWDADRLDLGRIGITPRPRLLCTEVARRDVTIRWATEKAEIKHVPGFVREEWGIRVKATR